MADLILNPSGQTIKPPTKLLSFEPTHASRYWIIAGLLKSIGSKRKVLDVGGKKGLLGLFPEYSPTIIDLEASDEPNYIQGDALDMPFNDNEFDVSVSCDVLEHIPSDKRDLFIKEMLRVSERYVIICAPFNRDGVADSEKEANDYYYRLTRKKHQWLQEHIDNGLPEESQTESTINQLGYKFVKFHHFSLDVWQSMVKIHMLHAAFGDNAQIKLLAKRLYATYYSDLCNNDFSQIGYRTFYVISKQGSISLSLPSSTVYNNKKAAFQKKISESILDGLEKGAVIQRKLSRASSLQRTEQAKIDKLNQELAKTQQQLDAILASRSWKLARKIATVKTRIKR